MFVTLSRYAAKKPLCARIYYTSRGLDYIISFYCVFRKYSRCRCFLLIFFFLPPVHIILYNTRVYIKYIIHTAVKSRRKRATVPFFRIQGGPGVTLTVSEICVLWDGPADHRIIDYIKIRHTSSVPTRDIFNICERKNTHTLI